MLAERHIPASIENAGRWPLLVRLVACAAILAVCLVARRAMDPVIGAAAPFSIFYIGVALSAYLGGTAAALIAALLCAIGVDYWYLGDRGKLDLSAATLGAQSVFLSVSAVFIATVHALRRIQAQLTKRAGEVEQQREWFQVTLSSIGDGVITTDTGGRITFVNPAAAAMTGWNSAKATGQAISSVFRVVNERTREPLESPILTVIEQGKVVTLANRSLLIARDGRELSIEDSAAPIRDKEGCVLGAVVVFHDVTERRRDAGALRAAESRKSAILDASLDAIVTMDHSGRVVDFNRAAERIFGYEASYALGKTMGELIIPERYRDRHQRGLERLLATGEAHVLNKRLELSALHADGHEFPVELSISQISGVSPPMFTGTLRDITHRKRAEEALRSSEERQRATFEQAAVGIALAELDGRLVEMNAKAAELFGYPIEELKGRTFLEFTHPDDVARTLDSVQRLLRGEIGHYALEKRYVRKDRTTVWSMTSVTLLKDADGKPQKMIGVLEDITRRKTAEEALRESEAVLRVVTNESRVGLVLVNAEGRYLFANATYAEVLGLDNANIIGRHIKDVLPAVYDQIEPRLDRAFRGERVAYELRLPPKDGAAERFYEVIYEPRKAGGPDAYVVVVLIDITRRKAAEATLRDKEEELRAMADSIPQLAWMAEPDGNVFWYNRGWFDYTGTTLEQMQGWGWQSVHDAQILPAVMERWQESIRSGVAFEMEFPLRGADGVFRWFLTRVNPLRDADGRVLRWFGTNTNVDEVRRTREALREETRVLELLNDAGAAIASKLDLQSLVQTVTDAATQLSGAKFGAFFYNVLDERGEALLLYTLSGAPREAFERFGLPRNTPVFNATFRGEGVVRSADITKEARYGTMSPHHGMPTGHLPVRSYLAVPVIARSGEVIGGLFFGHPEPNVFTERSERLIVAIAAQAAIAIDNAQLYESAQQEIKRRTQIEAELRASEARLRVSLEASALGTWDYDPATGMMSLDRRCQELFGMEGRATIDLNTFFAIAHPEDRARREQLLRRVLDNREGYEIEYRTATEPVRWLRAAGRAVGGADGKPSHVVTAVADITDLVKARESMAERRRELEALVKARTASLQEAIGQMEEFSYSVSHDLRAPLRAIQGYAEAVIQEYADQLDATGRGYLEKIASAALRMDRLTQDVLTYSKIGRDEMRVEPVSLQKIVAETLEQYVQGPTSAHITIASPLPDVLGHEALLVQAVSNLVTNAIKFVKPRDVPRIQIRAEPDPRGVVRLWIEDQGIGIPLENQARIWGLFERVHPRSFYEGTGVGLAIVRKAVERMGGAVGVVSDGKNGSKFWIELPQPERAASR